MVVAKIRRCNEWQSGCNERSYAGSVVAHTMAVATWASHTMKEAEAMTYQFNLQANGRAATAAPIKTMHAAPRHAARITINHFSLLIALLAVSISATAQNTSLAGTWTLAAADKILPDGTRVPDYGSNPHGLVIFTSNGYYSVQIYRAERLKFASGDKFKGSFEEYQDASLSMSTGFGRYSVDPVKHTIKFQTDRSSVPNRDDTTAVRSFELKGDELSWKVAPRQDGSVPITVLRRVQYRDGPIGRLAS
jgi:hypothetical protein